MPKVAEGMDDIGKSDKPNLCRIFQRIFLYNHQVREF